MADQNSPPPDDYTAPLENVRISPRSPRTLIEPDLPPPPPRSKAARHPWISSLNGIFSFILVLSLFSIVGLYFLKGRLIAEGPLAENATLIIPAKSGMADIAKLLHQQNVISDPLIFQAGVFISHAHGELKAGEYLFPAHASMQQAIDILREGKTILHPVTIPEGLTSQQIVQRLMSFEFLTGEVRQVPSEGTLLPDTYNVQRGMTREQLLQRMSADQKKFIDGLMKRKPEDAPFRTPQELATLASIVEKETGKADERPHVAAVFLNRLKKHMKLQSDPTIIYGLAGGQGSINRPLTRADIDHPTPYNTYTIDGLPPTPIANPGRQALEAIIKPTPSADLYFVADGTGGHAFAERLEKHLENVARLRQIEHDRNLPQEPMSTTPPAGQETPPAVAPDQLRLTP